MLRKIVGILGILSLVAVLTGGGAAAYLVAKGTLTAESLHAAVEAITSEPAEPQAHESQIEDASANLPGGTVGERLEASATGEAAALGELEMLRRQIANERSLAQAARVEVMRERERLEQQRKQWQAQQAEQLETARQDGVQKELDYLSSIKADQALTLLMTKSDPEAARILLAMETRRGKKIIEMCKTADQVDWIQRILELIRKQNNVQAAALAGG